ncbi:hypothetical protein CTAYLR_001415 [Chrysophaeum taylorii]|uniref:Uncharacterized protein n=1 Tax=Chrysophaeum taylorii TaxID=2483200 RepID=A0AAD7UAZ1_9STRA|nr:hypothetical protein CTAYLR_001415 [Chrysophaeum taylorii]
MSAKKKTSFAERSEEEPGDEDNAWDKALGSGAIEKMSHTRNQSVYDNGARPIDGRRENAAMEASARKQQQHQKRWWCACGSAADVAEVPEAEYDGDKELRDPQGGVTYTIEKVIGEGGFSKVLLVHAKEGHSHVNRTVYAAKIIPKAHLKMAGDSFVKATMLERNILGDVGHPFILKLYHAFQEKDRLVLIVDFCVGGSVHFHVNLSVKRTGTGLDEMRSGFYVAEIALALGHLHKHGIVHRDLKLENVLLKSTGHLVICDFGTSKLLRPQRDAAGGGGSFARSDIPLSRRKGLQTYTKSIIGTPAYMAPEMLLEQPYNFSVDWWALGVTLFTMLRAKLPFDGGTHNDEEKMLWRIVKSRPRYDPNWTQPTLNLIQSLLQKLPKTRVCSLRDLKKADFFKQHGMDWTALEEERLQPPFLPTLASGDDTTYIPTKYATAPLPSRSNVPYQKGDSMRKIFRDFSHRASFEADDQESKHPVA